MSYEKKEPAAKLNVVDAAMFWYDALHAFERTEGASKEDKELHTRQEELRDACRDYRRAVLADFHEEKKKPCPNVWGNFCCHSVNVHICKKKSGHKGRCVCSCGQNMGE